MTSIYKFFAGFLLIIFLASCSHGAVGKKFEFDGAKDFGLIAYDIYFIGEITPNYSLYFFPYDAETKTINADKRTASGCGFICARGNKGIQFYIGTIDPGTYVIGYLFYAHTFEKRFVCFPEKTLRIDIEPGKIHYLGEMIFAMDHPIGRSNQELEIIPHDVEHVKKRLEKYPTVLAVDRMRRPDGKLRTRVSTKPDAEIVISPLNYVSFDPGERTRAMSCIRDYVD